MTTTPPLPPLDGAKGPLTSVDRSGNWSTGLEKARLYEAILSDIILGLLAPMEVLDERTLSRRYAGGIAGIREALGRLAIEGLVIRRPRVGTIVAPLEVAEVEHAFEVRRLLEGRTASLAASNHRAEDREPIRTAFDGAEEAIATHDLRALLTMDHALHRSIAIATHNPMLARFIVTLQNVATRFWIWKMDRQTPEEQMADVVLHRRLADAILRRDQEAAETAASLLVGDSPSWSERA